MSNNELNRKADMNQARSDHGLLKTNQKIFAFGSWSPQRPCKSTAEVYNIRNNLWSHLPDMPEGGSYVT